MREWSFRLLFTILFIQAHLTGLFAQLDTIHWIPPLYGEPVGDQFIDLTTPEEQPFPVTIEDPTHALHKVVMVSNAAPFRYKLSDTYSQVLLAAIFTGKVLPNSGIIIHGPKPFHAGFRVYSATKTDALYLTCKGRAALGKVFRVGNMYQVTDKTGQRNNFVGIMATENETVVTFSGYNPTLAELPPGPLTVTLQKGESILYLHFVGGIADEQPRNGFMGALLTATRPVVVNCGSWLGAPTVYVSNEMAGDQILPVESIGKEYVLIHGNGPTTMEHPIVVAHYNNTKVWINDEEDPVKILQAGEFFVVPTIYYLPVDNMYIHTSEPAYVYQIIGGKKTGPSSLQTGSFMFVPPINCGLPHEMNNINMPNQLNTRRFDGGLMIVAMRDSAVTARINGVPVDIGPPMAVRGTDEFVTYRAMMLFGHTGVVKDLRVESTGSIQSSIILRWEDAAYAAFFSGPVLRKPEVHLKVTGDGICPDTLTATGDFDGIRWIYDDSLFMEGPITTFPVVAPGKYKAIAYLSGCRLTATTADSLQVPLAAPQFSYTTQEPSCFDYSDGQIAIGAPDGGTPPYRYSIDFGQHLSTDPFFDAVHAGKYKLIVLDASGCYNEPVRVNMGQPDSVYVNLFFRHVSRPVRPGDAVTLEGTTEAPITATAWNPPDTSGCPDCLVNIVHPEKSTWVRLTVFDDNGCPGADSLFILVEPPVYGPNIFQPGAENGNDHFTLFTEKPLPVHDLMIFDRWGEIVFERHDFLTNNPSDGWDGTFRGKPAQTGVYVFIARVEVEPGRVIDITGDVLVER